MNPSLLRHESWKRYVPHRVLQKLPPPPPAERPLEERQEVALHYAKALWVAKAMGLKGIEADPQDALMHLEGIELIAGEETAAKLMEMSFPQDDLRHACCFWIFFQNKILRSDLVRCISQV